MTNWRVPRAVAAVEWIGQRLASFVGALFAVLIEWIPRAFVAGVLTGRILWASFVAAKTWPIPGVSFVEARMIAFWDWPRFFVDWPLVAWRGC